MVVHVKHDQPVLHLSHKHAKATFNVQLNVTGEAHRLLHVSACTSLRRPANALQNTLLVSNLALHFLAARALTLSALLPRRSHNQTPAYRTTNCKKRSCELITTSCSLCVSDLSLFAQPLQRQKSLQKSFFKARATTIRYSRIVG